MTLRDHINQMSNRELVEMIVTYDYEDYLYTTTDKKSWYDGEDAVEHQIELLEGEYNEGV